MKDNNFRFYHFEDSIPRLGDIIFVNRGLYKHYGIYNKDNSVIHFSPDAGKEINSRDAYIRETSLAEFLKGGEVEVDRSVCAAFPPKEVVRRALSLVGKGRGEYNLIFKNCEHFARWCASGEMESKQVKTGVAVAAGAIAVTAAVALIAKAVIDREDKDGKEK
jgi:hypothetical protein